MSIETLKQKVKPGTKAPTQEENRSNGGYVQLDGMTMYPLGEGAFSSRTAVGNYLIIELQDPELEWTREGFLAAEDKVEYQFKTARAMVYLSSTLDVHDEKNVIQPIGHLREGQYGLQGKVLFTKPNVFFNEKESQFADSKAAGYLNISGIPRSKARLEKKPAPQEVGPADEADPPHDADYGS